MNSPVVVCAQLPANNFPHGVHVCHVEGGRECAGGGEGCGARAVGQALDVLHSVDGVGACLYVCCLCGKEICVGVVVFVVVDI